MGFDCRIRMRTEEPLALDIVRSHTRSEHFRRVEVCVIAKRENERQDAKKWEVQVDQGSHPREPLVADQPPLAEWVYSVDLSSISTKTQHISLSL